MTTTENEKKLVSFMDLNPTLEGLTSEETFEKYKAFMEPIIKTKYSEAEVALFWKDYKQPYDKEEFLSWINMTQYDQVKEELKNDEKKPSSVLASFIPYKKPLKIEDMAIFDQLDDEFPHFKEITQYYRGMVLLNNSRSISNYRPAKPLLLLGNPGIGKTYYAKKLAKLFNTSYQFLDANSISATWVLSGSSRGWANPNVGWVFKLMAKSTNISPVFLIDEIDKLNSGKNFDPFSTFHQMFEKENSKEFYDEFMEMSFDASNIIYILTANDRYNIADSLLSRMSVFEVRNPTSEEMIKITASIYDTCLAESKFFSSTLKESELTKLTSFTPREVEQIISTNMFQQASDYSKNHDIKKNPPIDQQLIIQTFLPSKKGTLGFK